MQKITKMWKCWSITHTILAFWLCFIKILQGRSTKPQLQLRYVVFSFQNYQAQQYIHIFNRQSGRTVKSCVRIKLSVLMTITTLKFRKFGGTLELSKTSLGKGVRFFISQSSPNLPTWHCQHLTVETEAVEGFNIWATVIRPTSNVKANSPGLCWGRVLRYLRTAEGGSGKKWIVKNRNTLLCSGNKKVIQWRMCKAIFSRRQCFCIQTCGGTSRSLQAHWSYALSGSELKGPTEWLGISLEKCYLLWKQ